MLKSRRALLIATMAGAAVSLTDALSGQAFAAAQTPQPMASPNAPNQNVPAGMNGPDIVKPDKAAPNPINQERIAAMVHDLYKLSGELKDEIDHTNLKSTFSLSVVKKAQQIEKLAKKIKEDARG